MYRDIQWGSIKLYGVSINVKASIHRRTTGTLKGSGEETSACACLLSAESLNFVWWFHLFTLCWLRTDQICSVVSCVLSFLGPLQDVQKLSPGHFPGCKTRRHIMDTTVTNTHRPFFEFIIMLVRDKDSSFIYTQQISSGEIKKKKPTSLHIISLQLKSLQDCLIMQCMYLISAVSQWEVIYTNICSFRKTA